MRFDLTVRGDPIAIMEAHIDEAEKAVTRGLRLTGEGLKKEWRGQVVAAGLGQRLGNTIRARTYPERLSSISASSLVYSRAPVVVDAHDRGVVIVSGRGWLAIPIGDVQKMRGARSIGGSPNKRITPAGWEQKTGRRLRFVYRKGKPALLVDDGAFLPRGSYTDDLRWRSSRSQRPSRGKVSIPIFLLVPQVKLRRKLDLDRATVAWGDRMPGLILDNWRDVDG